MENNPITISITGIEPDGEKGDSFVSQTQEMHCKGFLVIAIGEHNEKQNSVLVAIHETNTAELAEIFEQTPQLKRAASLAALS